MKIKSRQALKYLFTLLIILLLPNLSSAFISLCFPISLVAAIIWIQGILLPLAGIGASDIISWLGIPATLFFLHWFGKKRELKGGRKYLRWKLPALYLLLGIIIILSGFFDPTCDGSTKQYYFSILHYVSQVFKP